jgi:hypothetical protein
LFIFVLCQIGFESFGKFAAGEHNPSSTALAFEPDIRAETCDGPLIGATGMLFSEAEMVVEAQVG